jgi:hypothetical protein
MSRRADERAVNMSAGVKPLVENATRDLARFAAGIRFEDIPREAVERIKLSVLDSIGCCLFGATLPWTLKVADLAQAEGARPVASFMGMGKKSSVSLAALVNGTAGHAFELDDIHKESIVHAGSIASAAPRRRAFSSAAFIRRARRACSSPLPLPRARSTSMPTSFNTPWV